MHFIVENQSGEQIDGDDDIAVAKQKCDGRPDGFRVVRAIDGAVIAEWSSSHARRRFRGFMPTMKGSTLEAGELS